jgi:uncharacterized membrane protein HdeD (DUF308 family)
MKWLTFFFALFILLIIILADLGKLGILRVINQIPWGDKAGHFILYGILTLLLDLTFIRSFPNRSPKLIVVLEQIPRRFTIEHNHNERTNLEYQ